MPGQTPHSISWWSRGAYGGYFPAPGIGIRGVSEKERCGRRKPHGSGMTGAGHGFRTRDLRLGKARARCSPGYFLFICNILANPPPSGLFLRNPDISRKTSLRTILSLYAGIVAGIVHSGQECILEALKWSRCCIAPWMNIAAHLEQMRIRFHLIAPLLRLTASWVALDSSALNFA
jgi:hypothetical protein